MTRPAVLVWALIIGGCGGSEPRAAGPRPRDADTVASAEGTRAAAGEATIPEACDGLREVLGSATIVWRDTVTYDDPTRFCFSGQGWSLEVGMRGGAVYAGGADTTWFQLPVDGGHRITAVTHAPLSGGRFLLHYAASAGMSSQLGYLQVYDSLLRPAWPHPYRFYRGLRFDAPRGELTGLTESWCWSSPASSAREPGGPVYQTFDVALVRVGDLIVGFHNAIAAWGNRIDDRTATDGPPSMVGRVRGDTATVEFVSGYSGNHGLAQLVLRDNRLEWVPLTDADVKTDQGEVWFADWYLPWEPVTMAPCAVVRGPSQDAGTDPVRS
jgi:hypothetical protein